MSRDVWPRRAWSFMVGLSSLTIVGTSPAITGRLDTNQSVPSSVVALGSLPVACGAEFATQCSGVVLTSRLVLTAAHCLPALRATGRPQVFAANGNELIDVSALAELTAEPPDTAVWDIGILTLSHAIASPPVQLASGTFDEKLVGTVAAVAGFGLTDASPGTNRVPAAGTVAISSLDEQLIRFSPAPNMICDGDSGGPLFANGGQGLELAGILSQADANCSVWGSATRLDTKLRRALEHALSTEVTNAPVAGSKRQRLEGLCSSTCSADAECPSGTHCNPTAGGVSRCVPAGLLPGELSGSCAAGANCAECVQLEEPSAPCACYRYCAEAAPAATPSCALVPTRPISKAPTLWAIAWSFALALLVRRAARPLS